MSKHLELRYEAPTSALVANMEKIAGTLDGMDGDDIRALATQTREVTELDHLIAKIDAIQAELWRREQKDKKEGQ